jgi:bla regulator protein blaR1
MPLLFLNPAFSDDTIRALSWTLIHSLWQGMLLAMAAGGIVFFTKKASPALRYNLLTGALLVFIFGITTTFSTQIITNTPVEQIGQEMTGPIMAVTQPAATPLVAENKLPVAAMAIGIFNANSGWIVLAWFLIIALRCVQLTAGLYGVYQLKRRQTFSPGEYWSNRITELSRQLRINKRVQLLQSGIARMPSVIGYFKPVILFPAGMLASLPPDEVEAILIHELAHIRRKDFLVNVMQHIIEIIFFFNPAVRWVSSLIRSERENCCDDIAVSQTDNKRNYIKALIAFQGFDLRLAPPLSNAFAGEKNHLMNRVKRIIYNNNKTLNNMEKKFLAAGMIITSVFIFAFTSNNLHQKATEKNTASQNAPIHFTGKVLPGLLAISDTVPDKDAGRKNVLNGTINSTVNGRKYKIVTRNDQVAELYVNGKKVAAEKMAGYKSVTDKMLADAKSDMAESEKDGEESKAEMEESEKEMAQARLEMEQEQAEMAKEMEQAKKEMEQEQKEMMKEMDQARLEMEQQQKEMAKEMEQGKEESKTAMEQSKKEMEQAKLEMEQSQKEMKENMEQAKKDMEQNMEQAKKDMELAKKEMEQSRLDMAQSRKDMEQSKKDMAESKKMQESIIADFIKEHIIKDKKELSSYKLSNEELIVNGIKQPDAIYKKFKTKYVKGNNWTIEYNFNSNEDVK